MRERIAGLAALRGWRRLACAFVAGAFGALAMPPYGFLPALAVALCVAVWLMDGAMAGRRRIGPAFLIGWAWGFGFLTAGLWWLGSAFLVEADEFLWALPLGVTAPSPRKFEVRRDAGTCWSRMFHAPIYGLGPRFRFAGWMQRGHQFLYRRRQSFQARNLMISSCGLLRQMMHVLHHTMVSPRTTCKRNESMKYDEGDISA